MLKNISVGNISVTTKSQYQNHFFGWININFSIWFVSKKTINKYLGLEIHGVCRECLAFKTVFLVFFEKKFHDYLFLHIRNLENHFFGTQNQFEFEWAGREF